MSRRPLSTNTLSVIVHNIRSVHNVGSIFRTADGVGVSHVYLTGYTPTPVDRFGRKRTDMAKTALGAEETIPWSSYKSAADLIKKLQRDGVLVVALEQSSQSVPYTTIQHVGPIAVVVGNEVRGLSKETLFHCDAVAEIPMCGEKESLNVAVALGVFLFRLRDGR